MHEITLSKRILHWPQQCACCYNPHTQNPNPDKGVTISYTNSNSRRANSWTWTVPYCSDCLAHLENYKLANEYYYSGDGRCEGYLLLLILTLTAAGITKVYMNNDLLTVTVAIAVAGLGIIVVEQAARETERENERKERIRLHYNQQYTHFYGKANGSCTSNEIAAEFKEKYGDINRISFSNQEYAALFNAKNVGKKIDGKSVQIARPLLHN